MKTIEKEYRKVINEWKLPRKPLRKVSKRRARENAVYVRKKFCFFADNHYCFVCKMWVMPWQKSLHHFFGRVGALLTWVPGFRLTHQKCHEFIETHRKQAIEMGLRADERLFNRPSLAMAAQPEVRK